jgi:hypothetical protein
MAGDRGLPSRRWSRTRMARRRGGRWRGLSDNRQAGFYVRDADAFRDHACAACCGKLTPGWRPVGKVVYGARHVRPLGDIAAFCAPVRARMREARRRPSRRRYEPASWGQFQGRTALRRHDQSLCRATSRRLWNSLHVSARPRPTKAPFAPRKGPVADLSVKKYRLAVLQARGCAIPTAQAETARIAARRLAALARRWCGRSVVSAQRSAAVALF